MQDINKMMTYKTLQADSFKNIVCNCAKKKYLFQNESFMYK